jgi:hypothetical protein
MDPPDSRNLTAFLEQYERIGKYVILPAHFSDTAEFPEPFWELWIGKRELHVRPAWQIDENDPDGIAVGEDDDPIIPDGIKDAPVIRVLQRFPQRKRRKRH